MPCLTHLHPTYLAQPTSRNSHLPSEKLQAQPSLCYRNSNQSRDWHQSGSSQGHLASSQSICWRSSLCFGTWSSRHEWLNHSVDRLFSPRIASEARLTDARSKSHLSDATCCCDDGASTSIAWLCYQRCLWSASICQQMLLWLFAEFRPQFSLTDACECVKLRILSQTRRSSQSAHHMLWTATLSVLEVFSQTAKLS